MPDPASVLVNRSFQRRAFVAAAVLIFAGCGGDDVASDAGALDAAPPSDGGRADGAAPSDGGRADGAAPSDGGRTDGAAPSDGGRADTGTTSRDGGHSHAPIVGGDPQVVAALPFRVDLERLEPWLTYDATFERFAGWRGEPALRIYPPNTGEGMAAVGQLNGIPPVDEFHIGFLYRIGSTLIERHGNTKQIILLRDVGERPMLIWGVVGEDRSPEWRAMGACDNTLCQYGSAPWFPTSAEAFKYGHPATNAPGRYGDEWVWFEFIVTQTQNQLQIWTEDGLWAGTYVTADLATPNGTVTDVDGLGGYWAQGDGYDPNAYYEICDIELSGLPIGPPW